MSSVLPLVQADRRDPLIDQARVLPRAQMTEVIDPTWEREVENGSTTSSQPCFQAFSCFGHDLELDWPTGLLLDYGCSVSDMAATHHITDPDLYKVTTAQFTVDGQIEQRPIAQPPVLIEVEPDGPDVARLEWTLGSDILTCIPGRRS